MFRNSLLAIALAATTAWAAGEAPDLKTAADKSMKAMGADTVKTLVISGEGWDGCVGQNYDPNSPNWRKFSNKNYVRSIDFDAKGWRLQRVRGEGENPGRGGCNAGPVPDTPQNQVTNLNANSPWNTQMEYILLPEGFLKTALEKNAMVQEEKIKGKKYTVISFMGDKAPVNGYINDMGYVEKVETKIDNNVLGDIVWDAEYTNWKDFGGVKFPTHIVQHQGTPVFFELNVADVKVNAPVDLSQPPGRGRGGPGGARGGRGPGRGEAAGPISEDLGGGFWLVTGGYGAVVADFKDYIVVIEGPQNDMRAEQIIAEAKRLVPNKPIKYVINTHTHFDHSGGLRAFVAEGTTIVTQEENKSYYEKIFKYPHTLVPDMLSQKTPQPKVKIETVKEMKEMTDGEHTIDLYHLQGSTHAMGTLIIYLPKQKILVEADEFNVGQANAPTPASINPYQTNLLANIERLKLDVDRIIPIHLPGDNRKVMMAELYTAAGKEAKK
ncbi:MAG TPA: MBL fold metallo-hydrolase [Bryobacteraceae bacterium]|jgi:glyoxylase-like metal-dependent hydrolase (beta-lactamase superfamily II)